MRRVFRMPFGRTHIAREVDDELAFHLEMRMQRLIASGMTPDAARQEALRQFGNVKSVREDCVIMDEQRERAMSRANMIGELRAGRLLRAAHTAAQRRLHRRHRLRAGRGHRREHGDLHADRRRGRARAARVHNPGPARRRSAIRRA